MKLLIQVYLFGMFMGMATSYLIWEVLEYLKNRRKN